MCTERCAEGRFGPNCVHECVCHNGGHCDPETGQCQCADGFTGTRCECICVTVLVKRFFKTLRKVDPSYVNVGVMWLSG